MLENRPTAVIILITVALSGNPSLTRRFPHKGPVMRKTFRCHDFIFIWHHVALFSQRIDVTRYALWNIDSPTEGRSRSVTLRWRHNERDGVSNHQPHVCLLNRSIRRRSKKTSKLRVTGLCEGNPPVTGEFLAQMASNAVNVSFWWRHH